MGIAFNIPRIVLPVKRPFNMRTFLALVVLYFLGNLAGVPLLLKTRSSIEPVWFWGIVTLISALGIALSLVMADRTSLGLPYLEGYISKGDLQNWLRSGLALTALMLIIGLPLGLVVNLNMDGKTYPFGWELLPASFKAGAVEEIGNRLFLMSLFVWLGSHIRRDEEKRPARSVYWSAIILAGVIFGWAHVDARLGSPAGSFWWYALIMLVNTIAGIYFGWLFWMIGLEWSMFAHFAYDVFISMVVIPVYLLKNPFIWAILIASLVLAALIAWRFLLRNRQTA